MSLYLSVMPSALWPRHENLTFLDFLVNIAISWQKLLIDLSICTNPPATDWRQQLKSICWKLALLYIKFYIHKMTCIFILIWNYGSSSYSTNNAPSWSLIYWYRYFNISIHMNTFSWPVRWRPPTRVNYQHSHRNGREQFFQLDTQPNF